MSWILIYLMAGVALLFVYEQAIDYVEAENQFTKRERIIVGLLWPIAVIMLIWSFIQVFRNGPN